MKTVYLVMAGPVYPPALRVESTASFCLLAQEGCKMEVLLTRTIPGSYRGSWLTRLRNQYRSELEELARNLMTASDREREVLLQEIKKQREVEVNVAEARALAGLRTAQAKRAVALSRRV